ncbi:MAG TPA: hypothetical protein VIL40_03950 [Thermaerobacter sp.]
MGERSGWETGERGPEPAPLADRLAALLGRRPAPLGVQPVVGRSGRYRLRPGGRCSRLAALPWPGQRTYHRYPVPPPHRLRAHRPDLAVRVAYRGPRGRPVMVPEDVVAWMAAVQALAEVAEAAVFIGPDAALAVADHADRWFEVARWT